MNLDTALPLPTIGRRHRDQINRLVDGIDFHESMAAHATDWADRVDRVDGIDSIIGRHEEAAEELRQTIVEIAAIYRTDAETIIALASMAVPLAARP